MSEALPVEQVAPPIDPLLEAWLREEKARIEAIRAERDEAYKQAEADVAEAEERRVASQAGWRALSMRLFAVKALLGEEV